MRGGGSTVKTALDPNDLFDEIVLDSRLADIQVADLKSQLRNSRCRLSTGQSLLYQAAHLTIELQVLRHLLLLQVDY
jgi:hypothetical protein